MVQLHYLPPTDLVYQSHAPSQYYGYCIAKYFATRFTYLQEDEWISHIRAGSITVNGKTVDPGYILKEHDHIIANMGPRVEPPANRTLEVIFEDSHIRVFNKAAPIPVHPSGRYFKNSMTEILKEVFPDEVPRPVQRLDATTTGILVFARTRKAASFLMNEFVDNRVTKEYLALVEGVPGEKKVLIDAPIGKIKGSTRGIGKDTINPKSAVTEIEWLSTIGKRSLLKVVPRSGRTNQIRVHLASVGLPIINDAVYGHRKKDFLDKIPALVDTNTKKDNTGKSPLQFGLHAHRLSFHCFETAMEITASCPAHFQPFLDAQAT